MSERIPYDKLATADLVVDSIYESDRNFPASEIRGEPLNPLMGVGNLGGSRPKNGQNGTLFSVLTSTGVEAAWPDSLNSETGVYTYFGDNRKPGRDLHKTPNQGNEILKKAFELASSTKAEEREKCPIFFVFHSAGTARDFVFKGLAVPGTPFQTSGESLVAVWRTEKSERFQNYRASMTILSEGVISGDWLRASISAGKFLLDHEHVPSSYLRWVRSGQLNPLVAPKTQVRSVTEQIPQTKQNIELILTIQAFCDGDAWKFERVAAEIWKMSCPSPVSYDLTQRYRDGGRDAIGYMTIGPDSDPIKLDFSLEAKLYSEGNNVGVREISRLISRIRHREFGVLVTTSSVSKQAYSEIREDGHPIVVVSGSDICEILVTNGIVSKSQCQSWLNSLEP